MLGTTVTLSGIWNTELISLYSVSARMCHLKQLQGHASPVLNVVTPSCSQKKKKKSVTRALQPTKSVQVKCLRLLFYLKDTPFLPY